MNWLSKKLIVSKLKGYFHIENENNIEISLLGKQQLKFNNLTLKPQNINKPESLIHIENCQLSKLQILFDRSSDSPLIVNVDKVDLVLKFNKNKIQTRKDTKSKERQELKQFHDALSNESQFQERNFFQQEIFQLKRMFKEFILKKLSLQINNIDISVEYENKDKRKYFGLQVGEIKLMERVVINNSRKKEYKSEQLNCIFDSIALYIGLNVQEDVVKQQAKHRSIVRKKNLKKKKYLMEDNTINAYYNIEHNRLSIQSEEINFKVYKILIYEAGVFLNFIKPLLSDKPKLRPGQGKIMALKSQYTIGQNKKIYDQELKVSEGTIQWWQTIGNAIIKKFHSKENMNILKNKKFKKYLYCLLYRYTFGAVPELEKIIESYEYFKSSLQIMKYHRFILQKLDRIQKTKGVIVELKGFIIFIRSIVKGDQILKALKLKKIEYQNVKNSNIIINLDNCQKYLDLYEQKLRDQLGVSVMVKCIKVQVATSVFIKNLEKQFEGTTPIDYHNYKNDILDFYCNKIIVSDKKIEEIIDFSIIVNSPFFQKNDQGNTYLEIKELEIFDHIRKVTIALIKKLTLSEENLHPQEYKWAQIAETELNLEIQLLHLHLESKFVANLLLINSFLTKVDKQVEEDDNFMKKFIRKKIPQHVVFNSYSKTSKRLKIRQCIISTPVLDKERILEFDLNDINFNDPVNEQYNFDIRNFLLIRSTAQNLENKLNHSYRKIKPNDETIILANNRPFNCYSLEKGSQSITSILLPFILVQITCQDLYYFFNIMKLWGSIFSNKFFFPVKEKIKSKTKINPTSIQFTSKMEGIINFKNVIDMKMQGIQLVLVADQILNNDARNKVLQVMIDTVVFRKESEFSTEKIQLQMKDLFVHNTLGNRIINKESLVKSIKRNVAFDDSSILMKNSDAPSSEGQLIFYSDSYQGRELKKSFIQVSTTSFVNLLKMKMQNQIKVFITPIFIFHCHQFFQNLMLIINIAKSISEQTINAERKQGFYENQYIYVQKSQEHELLMSEQFPEITKFYCKIEKINALIINQPHIVYSFSFDQFLLTHSSQPYIRKMNFQIQRFAIVDTSPEAGPYPIIIDTKIPVTGSLTQYHSWLLQQKHKMASLLKICLQEPKAFFLKKKVMELTNFILATLKLIFPQEKKENKNQGNTQQYGFCYFIQLLRPKIIILRGSLSTEGFKSVSDSITVRNFESLNQDDVFTDKANMSVSMMEEEQQYFQSCSQLDQESFEFKSFRKDGLEEQRLNKKISIDISNFIMHGERQDRKREKILIMKQISVDFESPQLIVNIPELEMNLNEEDYRVLIRVTQQNLGQSPILFLNKSPPKPEVTLSFKTLFMVHKIIMRCYSDKLTQEEKLFELEMNYLRGTNVILTNGQNQTEMTIDELIGRTKTGNLVMGNKKSQKYTQKMPSNFKLTKPIRMKDYKIFDKIEKQNRKLERQIHEDEQKIQQLMKQSHLQHGKIRPGDRQQTNSEKICKWFQGMCMKCCCCFCCCEKEVNKEDVINIVKAVTDKQIMYQDLESKQLLEGQGDLDVYSIHSFQDILNVKSKINPQNILKHENQDQQEATMIYLDFLMKPWGQKHMYMLVKDLAIILEKQKALNPMIAFFYKPYQFPQIPDYFRFPKFNNFRPFKMLIKLTDSVCQMIDNKKNDEEDKIIIALDAVYDSQRKGDTGKGPGKSKVRIETILKFFFINEFFKQCLSLSDAIQVSYITQQAVPFDQKMRTKSKQKIVMRPLNTKIQSISFQIPAYLIKAIQRVFTSSFTNKQSQEDAKENLDKSSKPQVNELMVEKKKPEQKKPPPPLKDSTVNRYTFIPEIKIQIKAKQQTTFLQTSISNTQISQILLTNGPDANISYRNIRSVLQIKYWNLKLAKFQPFLESWKFKLSQVVNKRDQIIGTNLKVSSDFDAWKIHDQYINDLNINISTAFFHTIKEIQIKYEQQEIDEEQICHNLTLSTKSDYMSLFNNSKKMIMFDGGNRLDKFPEELKTFFGREFIIEGDFKNKKNMELFDKDIFNPPSLRIYLYHSYFDHIRRRKRIVYRTPFRIFNNSKKNFQLLLYSPKLKRQWTTKLSKFQYYALPSEIYSIDFLVQINNIENSDESQMKESGNMKFLSVSYLMQMKATKKDYIELKSTTRIWKQVFKYSNHENKKYIDERDMIIKTGDFAFTLISIKSEYQKSYQMKKKNNMYEEDIKLYDCFSIIFSPIVIFNYTHVPFTLKVNGKLQLKLKSNEKIQINEFLSKNIHDTVIEFQEDSLHEQFTFLKFDLGRHTRVVEIEKLQSINMVIHRQTLSTCFIELYAQWNITNWTNQDFSLLYNNKIFLIDKASFSCLSNIVSKNVYLSIIGQKDQSKTLTTTNIEDSFVLSKKIDPQLHQNLQLNRMEFQNQSCCSCCKKYDDIFENIQFVFNTEEDPLYPLSKTVQMKYKYQIANLTDTPIQLFQYNNNFLIASLEPQEVKYIFYYNFIPQKFILRVSHEQSLLESCAFELHNFPGKSFALKFRKNNEENEYHLKFHYLRVQVKKVGQESLIQIQEADFRDFPNYLDNVTEYNIKITENEQTFILKPQQRIPFAWSFLIDMDHKIQVQIEGCPSKTYSLNQKSEFQPIKIMDKTRKIVSIQPNALYRKQICRVFSVYWDLEGVYEVILDMFDNKLRIHNDETDTNLTINMDEAFRMEKLAQKIQVYFPNNQTFQICPSPKNFNKWEQDLGYCINRDVIDKIFFTIQSYKNSRIFFFRSLIENDYQSTKRQFSIGHINLSLISSKPQEVLLIYGGGITYAQHYRSNKLNYKNLQSKRSQQVLTIKKLKISNQLKGAVNPVVLTQIKKLQTPFLQVRLRRQNIMKKNQIIEQGTQQIVHYKEISFFLDQAQLMVEASLFFKILSVKATFDDIKNQYAVGVREQLNNKLVVFEEEKKVYNPQVYINVLDLKPLKMTISVYLQHNETQQIRVDAISILRYIPFGVENAIINIDSYEYFHIFYDQRELTRSLSKYYLRSIKNQILINAGSYDMFVPIQIVQGLGIGMKNLFYNPIYEFVKKKEIKAATKTCLQAFISLLVFILKMAVKLLNLIFKILAVLTFDTEFKTKREMFRKQIFKSPMDGLILGLRHAWRVLTSFMNMIKKPDKDTKISVMILLWHVSTAMRVLSWVFKLVVTFYDLLYGIVLGFTNWGYYQQSAMKTRSRPRRVFPHKQLVDYDYLDAHAHELINKYQMQDIERQQIYFVNPLDNEDQNYYLILSNYRILYNSSLSNCHQIKLYQISQVIAEQKKQKIKITIKLSIGNKDKVLFVSYNINQYELSFNLIQSAKQFLLKLKSVCRAQELTIQFQEPQLLKQHLKTDKFLSEVLA